MGSTKLCGALKFHRQSLTRRFFPCESKCPQARARPQANQQKIYFPEKTKPAVSQTRRQLFLEHKLEYFFLLPEKELNFYHSSASRIRESIRARPILFFSFAILPESGAYFFPAARHSFHLEQEHFPSGLFPSLSNPHHSFQMRRENISRPMRAPSHGQGFRRLL